MTHKLEETTIRDFGGGWDVSDSDKSLGSKYQPISDNIVRQTDGSFSIRPGSQLFADAKQGTETTIGPANFTANTFTGTGIIRITKTAHGLVDGNHVNITDWDIGLGGFTPADIIGMHGVQRVDANNFNIYVRKNAVASTSNIISIAWIQDTHLLGGRDIYGRYFKDRIFVFSDIGEIVAVDVNGTVTAVWNLAIARALAPINTIAPWGPCQRISAEIIKGRLIAVNGATNDKPLEILSTNGVVTCNYLLDAPGGGNTTIPRADFVIAADRYMLLISIEACTGLTGGPTHIAISAKDTYYVFPGNTVPSDSVEIDLGMLMQSVENVILGANVIRSKVFIAFHDRSALGELGIYTTAGKHDPDFKDIVAMLGSFSHASIVCLGNDIFCAAINGINSLAISTMSGAFTPTTISDLVHPVMLRHFGRLTENDRRYRVFAVWDSNFRSYMLFAPKYSDITYDLPDDPIIVSDTLQPHSLAYLQMPSHTFDEGDYVTLAALTASANGLITAGNTNGTRRIRAVADENTLVIEVPPYPPGQNYGYGGLVGTVKPINDETPAYVFEYNQRMKIKRWTRYRGMNFDWGTVSQLSKLFFGKDGRIYKFGNAVEKYSADRIGDYTLHGQTWANSTTYFVGNRIKDTAYKTVFTCLVNHTSAGAGTTFKQDRDAHPTYWEEFVGFPIDWELETSWTDFKRRMENKQIELARFDTKGSSEFEFSIYTNSIRTDFETWDLIPRRTTIFIGEDAPGFGAGAQPYGGGRNTRQEWLRGIPVEGKMFRLRFAGSSVSPLTVASVTMYYHKHPTALT